MRPLLALAALALGGLGAGRAPGAIVLMDQILDAATYDSLATRGINASQIFSDFEAFNAMALDDFTVASGELQLSRLSVLMLASRGFEAFGSVTGFQISIFSDPLLAQAGLLGDVASRLLTPAGGVTLTRITGSDLGLVDLDVDIELPKEGTYWVGVSVIASLAGSGQFYIRDNGANGISKPGGSNGLLLNPGEGFGRGKMIFAETDYAYRITAVPEPGTCLLLASGAFVMLRRRR